MSYEPIEPAPAPAPSQAQVRAQAVADAKSRLWVGVRTVGLAIVLSAISIAIVIWLNHDEASFTTRRGLITLAALAICVVTFCKGVIDLIRGGIAMALAKQN